MANLLIRGISKSFALRLQEAAKRRGFSSRNAFIRYIITEYMLSDAVQQNHMSQQTNELTLLEVIERNTTVLELIQEELMQ